MLNTLVNFVNRAYENFRNKKYLRGIGWCLLVLAGIICLLLFFISFIKLIYEYFEYIIIAFGGLFWILLFFNGFPRKKNNNQTPPPKQQQPIPYDPIVLENTYRLLRDTLCLIVRDISEAIRVKEPKAPIQIVAPQHFDIVSNAPVYHFLLAKEVNEPYDTYSIFGLLQVAIEQRLNTQSIPGITQSVFFYNGKTYPTIMVHEINNSGQFIQVDIAIANEYYCKYREERVFINTTENDVDDTDF